MKSFIVLVIIAVTALPWLGRQDNSKVSFTAHPVEFEQKDQSPLCIVNLSLVAGCHASAESSQQFVLVRGQLLPI